MTLNPSNVELAKLLHSPVTHSIGSFAPEEQMLTFIRSVVDLTSQATVLSRKSFPDVYHDMVSSLSNSFRVSSLKFRSLCLWSWFLYKVRNGNSASSLQSVARLPKTEHTTQEMNDR